jgi:hypothetical protein
VSSGLIAVPRRVGGIACAPRRRGTEQSPTRQQPGLNWRRPLGPRPGARPVRQAERCPWTRAHPVLRRRRRDFHDASVWIDPLGCLRSDAQQGRTGPNLPPRNGELRQEPPEPLSALVNGSHDSPGTGTGSGEPMRAAAAARPPTSPSPELFRTEPPSSHPSRVDSRPTPEQNRDVPRWLGSRQEAAAHGPHQAIGDASGVPVLPAAPEWTGGVVPDAPEDRSRVRGRCGHLPFGSPIPAGRV